MRRKSETVLLLVFTALPVAAGPTGFDRTALNQTIASFEEGFGESAAVIYEPQSGRIEYAYNRALSYTQTFSPGSLLKVFSALYLLDHPDEFDFRPSAPIRCTGRFYIPDQFELRGYEESIFNIRRDELGRSYLACNRIHGPVNLKEAIAQSCNSYFLTQAAKNPRLLYESLDRIWDMNGGSHFRINGFRENSAHSKRGGGILQMAASSIGEGGLFRVTPLKVAQMFGAVWMDTPLLSPFESRGVPPLMVKQKEVSGTNLALLHSALNGALHYGTLHKLKCDNPRITLLGGKTGSGTHVDRKFITHAWNAIFFSRDGERYVLVTFVRKGAGAREAGELSRRILNAL
jgi:cell division protein FtsI/penicillin-binding protein 2